MLGCYPDAGGGGAARSRTARCGPAPLSLISRPAATQHPAMSAARRQFRVTMKPRTPRKATASQRIEINRFWNELEEILDRLEDIKLQYAVDTNEEAENILNEAVECDREVETAFSLSGGELECWCKRRPGSDEVSGYNSDDSQAETPSWPEEEEEEEVDWLVDGSDYLRCEDLPLPPSFQQTRELLASWRGLQP